MGLVNNQKAYDQYLLCDDDYGNLLICAKPIGYVFRVRMPNFRGNYLSCVEELSFTLDGQPIAQECITVALNHKRFLISELPQMYKEYWDVNDCAAIEVECAGGLIGEHAIGATMRLRYGYSAYFGVCKVVTSHCEKLLNFTGKEACA
ncbi:MAG: DUF6379 domain-containing protein [Eubacteriales bacterium]|nr:DUF6379 domain-containing protein [Eubacteriales bacterium]